MINDLKTLAINGLWKNNPGVVQLLGLCPLLAVTGTVVNALGMALATLFVLFMSNVFVSLVRNLTTSEIRIPVFVMIIATLVTIVELLMQAYSYSLYQVLGIFLPLITTNCIVLGRAEAYASKNNPLLAGFDGLMMGLGFGFVLIMLGAVREIIGMGTLFNNMELLLGEGVDYTWVVFEDYDGVLAVILPPGAFLVMGMLIALKNMIDQWVESRRTTVIQTHSERRVRVTGHIK
jgi:Na+-translocating ferredoxin:NAD+ oxidoreductase subunit E